MKLLYCGRCDDVFNLREGRVKSCFCGAVSGRYVDYERAVVNGSGFSLAIGNGSFLKALSALNFAPKDANRKWFQENASVLCWLRPHDGEANEHTQIGNPQGAK